MVLYAGLHCQPGWHGVWGWGTSWTTGNLRLRSGDDDLSDSVTVYKQALKVPQICCGQ